MIGAGTCLPFDREELPLRAFPLVQAALTGPEGTPTPGGALQLGGRLPGAKLAASVRLGLAVDRERIAATRQDPVSGDHDPAAPFDRPVMERLVS